MARDVSDIVIAPPERVTKFMGSVSNLKGMPSGKLKHISRGSVKSRLLK